VRRFTSRIGSRLDIPVVCMYVDFYISPIHMDIDNLGLPGL
jgi:hypothetical protein